MEKKVLILVLMEDTLRALVRLSAIPAIVCLNPCFNGRYSQRNWKVLRKCVVLESLNPCFNGRYSQS